MDKNRYKKPHILSFNLYQMSRKGKFMKNKFRLIVARDLQSQENGK